MDYSDALYRLRNHGARIRRMGWNGKGMWLVRVPSGSVRIALRLTRPMPVLNPSSMNDEITEDVTRTIPVTYEAHIVMRAADSTFVPWLASQTDMLSDDWEEVPFGE